MKLEDLLKEYPRIQLVSPNNSSLLFSIIEKTSLQTSDLHVSFDRTPDFFALLKAQGEKCLVFSFHNSDGEAHGMACLSFREMRHKGQNVWIGYASDLRTSPELEREARVQWRKMYARVIHHASEIEEFGPCLGMVTAVWDDNKMAQKALVSQKKAKDFQYVPLLKYRSYSIWGRWKVWSKPKSVIRKAHVYDYGWIQKTLLESDDLCWCENDLERTLNLFNKSYSDFWVLEENGKMSAFILDVSQTPFKKLQIKAWPKSLAWAARLLPVFGKRPVRLNETVEMKQLVFFRSCRGDSQAQLQDFIHHFWNENLKLKKDEQFHILNIFDWNDQDLKLFKSGYLSTPIPGALYKVTAVQGADKLVNVHNFHTLEGNFL